MRIALIGFILVIVLAVGGLVVLAVVPLSPSVQKVEQVVPNDQSPH